jgi:hypothetical protein
MVGRRYGQRFIASIGKDRAGMGCRIRPVRVLGVSTAEDGTQPEWVTKLAESCIRLSAVVILSRWRESCRFHGRRVTGSEAQKKIRGDIVVVVALHEILCTR